MIVALILVILIALDQVVKYWALHVLAQIGSIPLINGVFHLTYVENRGAAFGILQDQRILFLCMTPIILAAVAYVLRKGYIRTSLGKVSLYLISAGALGNLIDRVWHGFVVDLFDFCLIHFPVFNIADVYVVVGMILFFYYFLIQHDKAVPTHE